METNPWNSDGSWNPWSTFTVKVTKKMIPPMEDRPRMIGKGGLSKEQQKTIVKPFLESWWEAGKAWSPFDRTNLDLVNCNIDSHRIVPGLSVRIKLKKAEPTVEAFLLYMVHNSRQGELDVAVMGAITREEAVKTGGKVFFGKLRRTRELGAAEFRAKMERVYAEEKVRQDALTERLVLKLNAFPLPLRCCVPKSAVEERVDWDRVYDRVVRFVVSAGWNPNKTGREALLTGWHVAVKADWKTEDAPRRHALRHEALRGMSQLEDVKFYLLGGIPAALYERYAEMRRTAELVRLDYYFSEWFTTEAAIKYLLKRNGLEDWLSRPIDAPALEEYFQRRPPPPKAEEPEELMVLHVGRGDQMQVNRAVQAFEEDVVPMEDEADALAGLPEWYGLFHFTDCPVSLVEKATTIERGMVRVFYDEIQELIAHWMELDQIQINGMVRANPVNFYSPRLMGICLDAEFLGREASITARSKVGGAMARMPFPVGSQESTGCGTLSIDIEELLTILPPCIDGMLKTCEKEKRSIKHHERRAFARFLAGLGIPESVYDSIAYPLFVAECSATGEKDDSLKAFKRRWQGKMFWSGGYANLSCMSVKTTMEEIGKTKGRNNKPPPACQCPFVSQGSFFGKNFTTLCREQWQAENPGEEDCLGELYYPSQRVYASIKAKRRRRHRKIDSSGK